MLASELDSKVLIGNSRATYPNAAITAGFH